MRTLRKSTLAGLAALAGGAWPAITIHVPDDVPTISQAVTLSSSGDTIIVEGGPYTEPEIDVFSKTITIEASGDVTWSATQQNAIVAQAGSNVTVRGFTIRDGLSVAVGAFSTGVMTAEDCTLRNNARAGASAGGGGTLVIRRCVIFDNPLGGTSLSHGGVRLDNAGTNLLIEDTHITGDKTASFTYGVTALDGAQITARNCTFAGTNEGAHSANSGSLVRVYESAFLDCARAITSDGGNVIAGNLGNVDPTDDGGNVLYPSCPIFYARSVGGSLLAEGNLLPRIDPGYISSRVTGTVDHTPSLQLVIDRVSVTPHSFQFPTPEDGQYIELRLVSDAPASTTVDLEGWLVSDDPAFGGGDEGVFSLPAGATIQPGETILLAHNPAELEAVGAILAGTQVFDTSASPSPILLSQSGDEVCITSDAASIHDAFLYGAVNDTVAVEHWLSSREPIGAEGTLFGRDDLGSDTNTAADWTSMFYGGRVTSSPVEAWGLWR